MKVDQRFSLACDDQCFLSFFQTHKEKQKKSNTEGLTSGKIVENLMFRRFKRKRRNLQSHLNMSHVRGSAKGIQEQLTIIEENKIIEKYRTSDQRKRYKFIIL